MAGRAEPEENYMTAVFDCDCGHGWCSIRSLKLPETCEKCKTRCSVTKYRKSTPQEQIAGRKYIMVAKYMCRFCGRKWKKVNSKGLNYSVCHGCRRETAPYEYQRDNDMDPYKYRQALERDLIPKRKYGKYSCTCGNGWGSVNAWTGKYQQCKRCETRVYPHDLAPLQPQDPTAPRPRRKVPHDTMRCQKCQEIHSDCTYYKARPDERVVFRDDESVLSEASDASTTASYLDIVNDDFDSDSSEENYDSDLTPIPGNSDNNTDYSSE